ncbi:Alpha/Beta hydrolase protein [Talaromyces proteolyticus]|uniref:Alpha/Beta hydrolase protein n=1 Tax=Talaromyces proteolyticus TaxID=1131652 RepID=A0AAD4L221_9EURO|nr:Alpha/Beta hydrolase protein [Talaromyces proteolyticus]KAH8705180.1 Alpha/Beta hydrolase protein [Talaromyces proteolyticus]
MNFPASKIHHPQGSHTHTVILLHGRGSDGPEFAEDIFSSTASNGRSLSASLPTYRWVFPTSRDRWSTAFQEEMCSWFDAYSLGDIQARKDLQKDGLRESVLHILDILEAEARLLDGQLTRIYLGGISQGMATSLWTFFAAIGTGRIHGPLAGLLGFCGWLPFTQQLEELLYKSTATTPHNPDSPQIQRLVSGFFDEIIGHQASQDEKLVDLSILSTPVFLSHGTDDAWVSVDLGRQASQILRKIMPHVEWNEFTGAENDGHWIKQPDGFDRILQFFERSSTDFCPTNRPGGL